MGEMFILPEEPHEGWRLMLKIRRRRRDSRAGWVGTAALTAGRAAGEPGQKLNSVAMPCKEAAVSVSGHWGSTGEL